MTIRLGVVMDAIDAINYKKDTTLAMLYEAKRRGWSLYYFEQQDLFLRDGLPYGHGQRLDVYKDPQNYFTLNDRQVCALDEFDIILMRKDPPVNHAYLYTTYILEQAEKRGVCIANRPQALRDFNEKIFATLFPECCPPNIVTQSMTKLQEFLEAEQDIVCKPLDGMAGRSVFRLQYPDVNSTVAFETLTHVGQLHAMAQKFIPQITEGDKRIIMIDGEAIPYALARVPQGKEWRGNLALGAKGVVQALTERDRFICDKVGPTLRAHGLYFVGIDVIGDYLTEINITSPTCMREIEEGSGINICAQFFDCLLTKLDKKY